MKNLIKYKPGQQSWVTWIKKRITSNLNFMALAEGPTGIGKSWAMLRMAYDIDPDFQTRQVAFSFRQVMSIINADWFKEKKWKVIIFDEAQTDIGNRQWQSLTNKLMNYLLSTFRHQNIILLFTSPYSDFIDSASMKLIHCKFEVRNHNDRTQLTLIRPKILQYNSQRKKFYEHSLHVLRDGELHKLSYWRVKKPPEHLIEPYEKAKTEFTDALNRKIEKELIGLDEKNSIDTRKPLTDQQEMILKAYKELGKQTLVSKKLGIKQGQISRQLKYVRNKGYSLKNEDNTLN